MEQYKVNLSDNVLVEVATMEDRYSYHVAPPPLTYHLYPNHPWSDGQILNEGEFKLGVRCLAPCEGECIVTGCLYQYVYAFPIQSKEESQEELWDELQGELWDKLKYPSARNVFDYIQEHYIITKKEGK